MQVISQSKINNLFICVIDFGSSVSLLELSDNVSNDCIDSNWSGSSASLFCLQAKITKLNKIKALKYSQP